LALSFFYTRGGAGNIRGRQIADWLKAKHNPKDGYGNDTCIYVKTTKPPFLSKKSYIDVCDAPLAIEFLEKHPEIGVISLGDYQKDVIEKILGRKTVLIPHHHCNFKRELRPDREVKVVGIIGCKNAFQHPIDDIRKRLKKIGLRLKFEENYWEYYKEDRQKVVDFYKGIDIQIVWRPKGWSPRFAALRSPLKLSNAGSFGIPTVSYPEPDYEVEWKGSYLPVDKMDDLVMWVERLKDNKFFYKRYKEIVLKKSEQYHIEYVAKLYNKL